MIRSQPSKIRGVTLVEAVLAVAVLAVAIPLVFAALASAGKSVGASAAETVSTWIVPTCVQELEATRMGTSRYFPSTANLPDFPPPGDLWALTFSRQGQLLAKIDHAVYDRGIPTSARYIARMTAIPATAPPTATSVRSVQITIEYPASAPALRRKKLTFQTHIL